MLFMKFDFVLTEILEIMLSFHIAKKKNCARGTLMAFQWPITSSTYQYLTIYIYRFLHCFLTINSHPPCQLSLWDETEEPGENLRLSAVLTMCDQMFDTGLEPMTTMVGGRRLDDLDHRSAKVC